MAKQLTRGKVSGEATTEVMTGRIVKVDGNDFEIYERLDAQPADLFQIRMACNAHHKRAKQQRGNDNFDEP